METDRPKGFFLSIDNLLEKLESFVVLELWSRLTNFPLPHSSLAHRILHVMLVCFGNSFEQLEVVTLTYSACYYSIICLLLALSKH